jgi:hypothetical protein
LDQTGFALNSERPAGDKAVIVTDQLATCLKEHQVSFRAALNQFPRYTPEIILTAHLLHVFLAILRFALV